MAMLVIFSILTGAVLGLRFKVLILVPVIVLSFVAIGGIGAALGMSGRAIAVAFVVAATALQAGYLIGTVIRFTIAAARAPQPRSVQLAGTATLARRINS
jgi:hypothetical protein